MQKAYYVNVDGESGIGQLQTNLNHLCYPPGNPFIRNAAAAAYRL